MCSNVFKKSLKLNNITSLVPPPTGKEGVQITGQTSGAQMAAYGLQEIIVKNVIGSFDGGFDFVYAKPLPLEIIGFYEPVC